MQSSVPADHWLIGEVAGIRKSYDITDIFPVVLLEKTELTTRSAGNIPGFCVLYPDGQVTFVPEAQLLKISEVKCENS